MDLDRALDFFSTHHHAVLLTRHPDGRAQMSPVLAGVADGHIVISTRETAVKVHNARRDPQVSVCAFTDAFFGDWIQVDGTAEIISLPDAMDHLIAYYRDISGEHPNWPDYRAAMTRDHRVILRIRPHHAGPDHHG
ncbi:PPOX class F420-dependent oxidoreductase [Nonomuraea sp. K274]|uniref:PPOX class F420-dependent oxidoreductase n=1 Tax=Nonomuraea cypriaca TaxID=1187855 RepID=A0A931ABK5_9ACTN|nr:PPOX class F420-dependent oxidoreductase [Nonomuraea cypriaca]MBF8188833.1 PPOX class F420-dependent oxidoreductase [Nonomuraea cypriaca]